MSTETYRNRIGRTAATAPAALCTACRSNAADYGDMDPSGVRLPRGKNFKVKMEPLPRLTYIGAGSCF